MAGRRRGDAPKRPANKSLAQYGLFDIPNDVDNMAASDGDSDLETELAALSGGGRGKPKPRAKPKPNLLPAHDLDVMIAASLRDVPSDEDVSDGDDDPDILNELSELTVEDEDAPIVDAPAPNPPIGTPSNDQVLKLLQERIQMYTIAEQNAKSGGDSGRARRFGRGLKTLKEQLKAAQAGKIPNDDDIPPPVSTAKPGAPNSSGDQPKPVITPTAAPELVKIEDSPEPENQLPAEVLESLNILNERRNQYKMAALSAKKSGDNNLALEHMKVLKQIDSVVNALKSGQPVDLSNMPGLPGESQTTILTPQKEEEHPQKAAEVPENVESDIPAPSLVIANTVGEALQQRLEVYKQQEAAAAEAGNSSKARRMGRIVKQYQQAIKLHSAGKPIPYDELPTPPGYAPIPGAPPPPAEEKSVPEPKPQPVAAPEPALPPQSPGASNTEDRPGKLANTGRSNSVRKMGNHLGTGHVERQLAILLLRQKQFKEAALNAKKKGELPEAKEFLRCAKGLDPLIDAARGGLPVDLTTIPLPPQAKQDLEDSYDIINVDDCSVDEDGLGDIMTRLEEQLNSQLKLCMATRDHHKALGDVAGANRFEHMALSVKQDLDVVRMAKRNGSATPKFHYETKQFSIVQSCTDLGDNDLELTIVRGINYNVPNPKDVDTFVRFEFPYPQEEPVKDKTALVKNTNNPDYNAVFVIPINRAQRPCQRIFKRQAVKLELYSKGGLFTRDSLIGTVNIKLQPLETQTILHDSFDLMDGRKAVGGKLEVKIRIRHPILTKQVEQTTQKWLIIDH